MTDTAYDDVFYQKQIDGSYKSARIYAYLLARVFKPLSVVDVGCGRGAWLKAFKEVGAEKLAGFDGPWNGPQNMIEPAIVFAACDLNRPIAAPAGEKFDLALSLEVAEHLAPASAPTFVESLTNLADVVLFGAAVPGQGGTNHVNEQPATYWAKLFAARGYAPFDYFRPLVWGDRRVDFWYQQNTFLYVRQSSAAHADLSVKGLVPLANPAFMDCVHPILYTARRR